MGEGTGEVKVYGDPAGDAPVVLDEFEVRVLGALLEKQRVTPDVYPLTLNSLVLACNQTTSRDPVVSYDETIVSRTLDRLRDKRLAFVFSGADSRALKYGHKLAERFILADDELAVLCLLFLRGPQTVGELRSRGFAPTRPIAVVNFTEEEGGRFGLACLGSRLMTGAVDGSRALALLFIAPEGRERVAHGHGQVAQPAFVADAQDGAAGHA